MTGRRFGALAAAVLLACIGLGAAAGWVLADRAAPQYEESATLLMTVDDNAGRDEGALQRVSYTKWKVPEFAAIATTDSFLARTIKAHKLSLSTPDLRSSLTVSSPEDTGILRVAVRAPSPVVSAGLSNAVAAELAVVIPERQGDLPFQATIVEKAVPTGSPVTDPAVLTIARYAVVGLVIGVGAVVVLRSPRKAVTA